MAKLDRRVAALEALQTPPEQPGEEMTIDEVMKTIFMAFGNRELYFDATGLCRAYWPGGHGTEHQAWLDDVVETVNEMRRENGTQPLLPLLTEDAAEALALLREGVIVVSLGKDRFTTDFNAASESGSYLGAQHMARTLGEAFRVFEDSGGQIEPFTSEGVIEVLDASLAEQ